ncbi:MAG: methyltransferase domain-containing protein [Clostridia bacterium]|nr:methyltransferase domain-containing protein [Clostridia bacterium]
MGFDLKSARHWAEELLRQAVTEGSKVIDATLGNGYDTEWLCGLVGDEGHVYGFDVQQEAVDRTNERLVNAGIDHRATLFCTGHQNVKEYVHEKVDAAVFNLGWLPGTDKNIRTMRETTLQAVEGCLELLKEGGLLTICAYPGHEEGKEELNALIEWAKGLDSKKYDAMIRGYLNQPNDPPVMFAVKKNLRKGSRK